MTGLYRGPGGTGDAESASSIAPIVTAAAAAAAASATAASASADSAALSVTDAEAAVLAAQAAQAAAELALDSFDDRYLGAKASAPVLDNDGDALIDGALYWDTVLKGLQIYDLATTSWNSPTSDASKVSKAGDTMTGPLLLPAGTVTTPALSFSADTDTGLYAPATGQTAITVNGAKALLFDTFAGVNRIGISSAGAAGVPTIYFEGDTNTGIYWGGSDDLSFAAGGAQKFRITSTAVRVMGNIPFYAQDGTVTAPGVGFNNDNDNGMYRIGLNNWGLTAGGVKQVDIKTTDVTFTNKVVAPMVVTDSAMSNRNKIINGDFKVWQRGTSFAAASGFTADRFSWFKGATAVATIQRSTDTPSSEFLYSLQVDVTTADAVVDAGDYAVLNYTMEGFDALQFKDAPLTLSFWVKSPKTGTHSVFFRDNLNAFSYIAEYTVSVANTWERKTITVAAGIPSATGTHDWTNGWAFNFGFCLMAGATFDTATVGSWHAGNFFGSTNQVNCMDSTANNFYITGIQMEAGSVDTPFEQRPYGVEVNLCQRYYYQRTARGVGAFFTNGGSAVMYHPVRMRTTPASTWPYTDANFSPSGAPPAGSWGLQIPGVVAISKTAGTITVFTGDNDLYSLVTFGGMTFSGNSTTIDTPDLVLTFSCEP